MVSRGLVLSRGGTVQGVVLSGGGAVQGCAVQGVLSITESDIITLPPP